MTGPGGLTGRAVILGDRQGMPINRPMAGMPQAQPEVGDPIDIPEYYQLDEAGMASEVIALRNNLKSMQKAALQLGMDLDNPATWTRGDQRELGELYLRATDRAAQGMQLLKQGYENQKYLRNERLAGRARYNESAQDGGPLTFGRVRQDAYSTNMPRVDEANDILSQPSANDADYQKKVEFYNQTVAEIEREVATGVITEDEGLEMISRLKKPTEFSMDPLVEAEIKRKRAQAANDYAKARKADRESLLEKPVLDEAGGFLRLVDKTRSEEPVVIGSPITSDLDEGMSTTDLGGYELAGNKGYTSQTLLVDRDGKGTLVFKPDGGSKWEEDGVWEREKGEITGKFDPKEVKRKRNGDVVVEFSETNLLPMFRALMSDGDYQNFRQALVREGYLGDGRLDRNDYEEYIRRNSGSSMDPLGMRGSGSEGIDL